MKELNKKIRTKDEQEIDDITHQFFDLFTNTNNKIPNLQKINEIFLAGGLLINNTSDEAAIYDLDSFIKPREEILTNGTLTNFIEKETSYKTEIYGKIAHRVSNYRKSGELNGEAFTGEGKKLLQFIKLKDQWVLSSVLWHDKK
jgi:hypothetical protein